MGDKKFSSSNMNIKHKMKDKDKTKEQILNELAKSRRRIAEFEKLETEHNWAEKVQTSIYKISEAAHSAENLEELYGSIHNTITELMPAKNFYIALYDRASEMLTFPCFVDEYEGNPGPQKLEKGLTEYVLRTGRPLLASPEVFDELEKKGEVESVGPPSIDWLGVPLKAKDRTIGVLTVQSYTEGIRYSEKDKDILTFISEQVAMAIERKQAEEAQRDSEERYHAFFEQAADSIFLIDAKTGVLVEFNQRAHENLGYTRKEFEKLKISDFEVIESSEEIAKHIEKVIKEGADTFETKHKKKSGEIRNIVVSSKSISIRGRDFIQTIVRDITERKQAEEELRSSEMRLKILFEFAPDAYYLNDLKGNFIDGNIAAEKITGYTRNELIGKNFLKLKLLPLAQMGKAASLLAKNARGQATGPDEFVLNQKDGTQVAVEISTFPVKIEGKTLVLGIARDISERKKAEDVLRESEEKFRNLAEQSPNMIFINEKGRVVYANKKCEELMGYKREEFYSPDFDFMSLITPEHKDKAKVIFNRHMKGKETPPYDYSLITKDGKRIEAILTTKLINYEGDRAILGIITDITERKKTEEQIKASLIEKEVLLKEVHHRVKNNMQIISSLLNLQTRHIKDEQALKIFKSSQNRVKSMSLIHERLYQSKDLARINFAEYARGLASHLFNSYGISSRAIKFYTNIKNIYLDINTAIPCGLIINELVSNSLKHAFPDGKKGEIKIAMHPLNGNEIELIVSDNGVGIPKEVDIKKSESLGLHLVTILAEEQLHGNIKLDRTRGTSFQMKLKLK